MQIMRTQVHFINVTQLAVWRICVCMLILFLRRSRITTRKRPALISMRHCTNQILVFALRVVNATAVPLNDKHRTRLVCMCVVCPFFGKFLRFFYDSFFVEHLRFAFCFEEHKFCVLFFSKMLINNKHSNKEHLSSLLVFKRLLDVNECSVIYYL